MSSTLIFAKTPVRAETEIASFKMPIKSSIAQRFYDHDGSLGGGRITISSESDLAYLEGLLSGYRGDDSKDLRKVVEHMRDHGSIDMYFS